MNPTKFLTAEQAAVCRAALGIILDCERTVPRPVDAIGAASSPAPMAVLTRGAA